MSAPEQIAVPAIAFSCRERRDLRSLTDIGELGNWDSRNPCAGIDKDGQSGLKARLTWASVSSSTRVVGTAIRRSCKLAGCASSQHCSLKTASRIRQHLTLRASGPIEFEGHRQRQRACKRNAHGSRLEADEPTHGRGYSHRPPGIGANRGHRHAIADGNCRAG